MYAQKYNCRKAERLHIRVCPELKKRFEDKVKSTNRFLLPEEQQDMSAWVNLLIGLFVACCDDFGGKLLKSRMDTKNLVREFSGLLTFEQFLFLYWHYYQSFISEEIGSEITGMFDSKGGRRKDLERFTALVESLRKDPKRNGPLLKGSKEDG